MVPPRCWTQRNPESSMCLFLTLISSGRTELHPLVLCEQVHTMVVHSNMSKVRSCALIHHTYSALLKQTSLQDFDGLQTMVEVFEQGLWAVSRNAQCIIYHPKVSNELSGFANNFNGKPTAKSILGTRTLAAPLKSSSTLVMLWLLMD